MCSAVATELPPYFWTMIPKASYLPTLLHQNSISACWREWSEDELEDSHRSLSPSIRLLGWDLWAVAVRALCDGGVEGDLAGAQACPQRDERHSKEHNGGDKQSSLGAE
jgi:hypothetical protein